MKAAIVKEDGLIYVNEVPEEPTIIEIVGLPRGPSRFKQRLAYETALASAIDSAILVADQKKARKILLEYHGDGNLLQRFEGIYPIPDLQWDVVAIDIADPVAILKESASTKQESQEDHIPGSGKMVEDEQDALWWKVFYVLEFSNVDPNNGIEELKRQFTITRKP